VQELASAGASSSAAASATGCGAAERVRRGVAGVADYNFRFANAQPAVIHDVLHTLARVI
jgi:hypothetical protein